MFGILVTLLVGLLMGGEKRIRQHVDELSKQAYAWGYTAEEEALVDAIMPEHRFTPSELATHTDMLSVGGTVYDISASKGLYGESGWYNYFVGKDATYVFGTGKRIGYTFEDNLAGHDPSDTTGSTPKQLRLICHYVKLFKRKYRKSGVLAPSAFFNEDGSPTEAKIALLNECEKVKTMGHEDGDAIEDGEELFETEDGEKPTKCPVMKTTKAIKKGAQAVADLVQKMIAG